MRTRCATAATELGLRVSTDLRNEKINYKVREHSLAKVPVLLVVGKKEAAERTVSIRRLGSDGQKVMPLDEALKMLADEAMPPDLRRALTARRHDAEGAGAIYRAGISPPSVCRKAIRSPCSGSLSGTGFISGERLGRSMPPLT